MSAIADFRIIKTDKLDALKEASEIIIKKSLFKRTVTDNYWSFIEEYSKKLKDFEWSGYIFGNLLIYLQENKKIDLLTSEFDVIADWISEKRGASLMIFTHNHKKAFLDKLDSENFPMEELINFNKEFSEDDDPELAKAQIAGIDAIKASLEELIDDKEIVILNVG
ncbi:hypothetical protein IFO69_20465 [Echinicola sp. CAU 1574]|uniref:Uncharacterized protein n=1 Tax=Echinicola arenosa TaxID=2774144 RepID=A0ABR9ARH1_9BACT|nr:hypothetical protein [Echinicola arenosa]MBD8491139.1 hypothetical protein [Echinicola arenosa]